MKQKRRFRLPAAAAGILCMGLIFGVTVTSAEKGPCSDDIAKFCKDVKPGGWAIMDCLEEHESELSDACKDSEAKMGGRRVEIREEMRERVKLRQACREDVVRLCNDIQPGPGVVMKCLNEHESELSAPCGERVKAARQAVEERTTK